MHSLLRLLTPLLACLMLAPAIGHTQKQTTPRATTAPAVAQALVHEQQLAAIRQALVDASLQAPTQVISTSWIDNMGALREAHQYNTKAEVRGIRLYSFGNEDNAERAPRASADVLPWGWRQDPQNRGDCVQSARHWRLPITIGAGLAPGFAGAQYAPGQSLLHSVERQVQAMLRQGTRWTPSEPPLQHNTTYLQALSAPARDEVSGWQLDIRLVPDALPFGASEPLQKESALTHFWGPAPWVWTLQLSLQNTAARPSEVVTSWRQSYRIPVDIEKLAEHPTQWRTPIEAELMRRIGVWLQGVQEQLRCEPPPFVVKHEAASLQLLASSDSGLRSGDRVLIMQPGWVPGRLLDPRVADHLALAEVVRTGPRRTEIRQLAGPPLPPGNDWVALPL